MKNIKGENGSGDVKITGNFDDSYIINPNGNTNIRYLKQPVKGKLEVHSVSGNTTVSLPVGLLIVANLDIAIVTQLKIKLVNQKGLN